jgi:CubicO group peptidase (beta-lactamase class C family)
MKKWILGAVALFFCLLIGGAAVVGITPAFVIYGPGVATGIGSKLLCSAEHVMKQDREQAFADLVQYSPILSELTIRYEPGTASVATSLFGLADKRATYIPGLGCAVDYPGLTQRSELNVQESPDASQLPWPAGETVSTIDPALQSLLESQLASDNAQGLNTRALLVVRGNQIMAEAYGQGAAIDSPLLGWSMAKSLMSIMLGNLELRGLIDLEARPEFAQWQGDERGQIRIVDMLTMTDGLQFSEEYNPGDDATAMLFTEPSMSDFVLQQPLEHAPGSRFNYSSGTANLLSRVHHDTLGGAQAAYNDFMTAIYGPMGFANAVFEMDASGVFAGSSYFYASARDWARIGLLMLQNGEINGHRLVSEDWVARATAPNQSENDRAYGYQFWLNQGNEQLRYRDLPPDAYFANGNRQQLVMIIPSADTVIVRLGWTGGRYPVNENFSEILAASTE